MQLAHQKTNTHTSTTLTNDGDDEDSASVHFFAADYGICSGIFCAPAPSSVRNVSALDEGENYGNFTQDFNFAYLICKMQNFFVNSRSAMCEVSPLL